jgi:hypothetical protein
MTWQHHVTRSYIFFMSHLFQNENVMKNIAYPTEWACVGARNCDRVFNNLESRVREESSRQI